MKVCLHDAVRPARSANDIDPATAERLQQFVRIRELIAAGAITTKTSRRDLETLLGRFDAHQDCGGFAVILKYGDVEFHLFAGVSGIDGKSEVVQLVQVDEGVGGLAERLVLLSLE